VFFKPWRVTGIINNGADMSQDIIYPSFLTFFVKKRDFLPFARFFVPENHVFWPFFGRFLIIGMLFFSRMA
jgi:hypothetical protein